MAVSQWMFFSCCVANVSLYAQNQPHQRPYLGISARFCIAFNRQITIANRRRRKWHLSRHKSLAFSIGAHTENRAVLETLSVWFVLRNCGIELDLLYCASCLFVSFLAVFSLASTEFVSAFIGSVAIIMVWKNADAIVALGLR